MNEYVDLSFLNNFFVQLAIHFIGNLIGIYITSLLIFFFIFLGSKISRNKVKITISQVINIYYISMYVVMFDLLFKAVNMLITGASFDNVTSSFSLVYALIIAVAQALIVIYFCRKKFNYVIAPSVYYLLAIGYQIFAHIVYT